MKDSPYSCSLKLNYGSSFDFSFLFSRTKGEKAIEREKRQVVYAPAVFSWRSMIDLRGKNAMNTRNHEFAGFANIQYMLFISQGCNYGARSNGACLLRHATPARRRHDGACALQPLSPDCAVNHLHHHPGQTELIVIAVE